MLNYDELFSRDLYTDGRGVKGTLHEQWLEALGRHHRENCPEYAQLCRVLGSNPVLPVRLFKEYDLRSVHPDKVVKTMTSSGTTGQRVSKIYLDKETSARQSKALAKTVTSFTGKNRMPLLIIDSRAVLKDRNLFSARGAGILGFSLLGRDVTYALDENMELDREAIEGFAERHCNERVMLFGFTFMVWQHLCLPLLQAGLSFDMKGVLIHGGGWKKLASHNITNEQFKEAVSQVCGVGLVSNYYGMVEQTGSIFMECECGHLHTSALNNIAILDPLTFEPKTRGRGVIVCTSLLPSSYPGHILLTEDEGEILGEDDCPCGRKGIYFAVHGRQKGAEIRGCSDTYEQQ